MLKISLTFNIFTTSRENNSNISRIKNAKFSRYYFYMNTNQWGDFQICTSIPLSFQKTCVIEAGLLDIDKMAMTVMKTTFAKLKLKL